MLNYLWKHDQEELNNHSSKQAYLKNEKEYSQI